MIEAVSKGLIDDDEDSHLELKRSRIEISPLKYKLTNGTQSNLAESNEISLERESADSNVKIKPSKKIKREKGKEKERVKDSDKNADNAEDKGKNIVREKLKRKTKKSPALDSSSAEVVPMQHIKEYIKPNEIDKAETINHTSEKSNEKAIENLQCGTDMEMDATIDSTNINILNGPVGETTPIPDKLSSCETVKLPSNSSEAVEGMATSTHIEMNMIRKQNRKHRKEKHRSKHGPNTDRTSSKEHKKKRKRKSHDHENAESFPLACGVPTIKIKVNIKIKVIIPIVAM